MKFKFPFEALQKVRKIEEGEAQRIFLEARGRLDECLAKIQRMYDSIDQARLEISRLQFGETHNKIEEIRSLEDFIRGQNIRIKTERENARTLMREVEDKQEVLIEKARAFKVIERLREKRLEGFKKEVKLAEQKELDEMVIARAKRRAL